MKRNRIMIRTIPKTLSFLLFAAILSFGYSCNNTGEKESDSERLKALSEEVKDVENEAEKIILAEKQELENELDSIIEVFEVRMAAYKAEINQTQKELNVAQERVIANLNAERDTLSMELEKIKSQSAEQWIEFKEEFEHDLDNFVESIEYFFEDNA